MAAPRSARSTSTGSRRGYGRWTAYGQSKLANLLFTLELQRRLEEAGSAIRALPAHLGYAASQDLPGASYVSPDGFQEQRGHPALARRSAAARDADTARRLWEVSEELTGVAFELTPAPV